MIATIFSKTQNVSLVFAKMRQMAPVFHNFCLEKNILFQKVLKDAQKPLIHPDM